MLQLKWKIPLLHHISRPLELLIAGKPSQGDVSRGGGEKQGGAKTAIPRLIPTSPPPCLIQLPKQKKTGQNRSKQLFSKNQLLPFPHYHLGRYICSPMFHISLKCSLFRYWYTWERQTWIKVDAVCDFIHETSPRLAIISTKMSMPLRKTDSWMNSLWSWRSTGWWWRGEKPIAGTPT